MRALSFLLLLVSFAIHAQLPDPELTAAERRRIAEAFAQTIETTYVLPDQAKKMAAAIRDHVQRGDYDNVTPAEAFVMAVVRDARAVNDDRHLRLAISSEVIPEGADSEWGRDVVTPEMAKFSRRINHGIPTAKILEGNVGYLDVELFPLPQLAGPTADAAMAFLAGTDALILDARRHRGGQPSMVAYLVSHFVQPGTLINTIYARDKKEPRLFHAVKVPKVYDKKVYVLTSKRTFSGGEELAYDLQALGRAKVYGEVTGGGAHPTGRFRIHDRFIAAIPRQRSVNPITKTNWEGVGVKPDVAVPAEDALRVAHLAALEDLAAATDEVEWRAELQTIAARLTPVAGADPRAALDAWMKSFNEHDVPAREKWLRENTTMPEADVKQYASLDQQIRGQHGPFELVRVMKTDNLTIEVEARHTRSGAGARIEIALDPQKPEKIGNVTLEPMQ